MTATPNQPDSTPTPKENTMTTQTPAKTPAAPASASEARALADKLEADERALDTRRRAARKAAELAEAKAEFTRCDHEMMDAINAANGLWAEAATAEPLDVNALAAAFVALRGAHAARAQSLATANAVANQIAPRYGQGGGQVDYRRDWQDTTSGASFAAELDKILANRAANMGAQAMNDTNARIHDAGRKAEEATH